MTGQPRVNGGRAFVILPGQGGRGMSDDDLIAAYRGHLTKEVQDAIMVAGIPPGKVANLYIEAGIMLALTLTSTAEVAADLRRAAEARFAHLIWLGCQVPTLARTMPM